MPTLRIEFIRLDVPKGDDAGQPPAIRQVVAEAELPIEAEPTEPRNWPTAPDRAAYAMLYAIGAPCYVAWSYISNEKKHPDLYSPPRKYVTPGESVMVSVKPGVRFACVGVAIS